MIIIYPAEDRESRASLAQRLITQGRADAPTKVAPADVVVRSGKVLSE